MKENRKTNKYSKTTKIQEKTHESTEKNEGIAQKAYGWMEMDYKFNLTIKFICN